MMKKGGTIVVYIASALSLVGIVMAWFASRRNKELVEQVEQVQSRIFNLRRELETVQEEAEQDKMALQFEILKLKGDLKITPEMQIGEIVAAHPQAGQVLAGFHIGGCSSCSVDNHQPLHEAVAQNGRDIQPILMALNTLVSESNGNGTVHDSRLKTSNVELQF